MTLIELIVALTITGLALGSGYSAYATLADRRILADHQADVIARTACDPLDARIVDCRRASHGRRG